MKKLIGAFSLAIILFSCGPKNTYTVKGTVSDVDLNGQYVLLTLYDSEGIVISDSAEIQDNKFSFTGEIETPTIYYIMMDNTPSYEGEITQGIPISIEPGTITVDIIGNNLKIGGNFDNETYQKILDKQFEMADKSNEYKKVLSDYLKNNIHSQMGQEIFRNNYYYLATDEMADILDQAPEDFKSQQDIQEFLAILVDYKKVAVGQPYIDFSLPDINNQTVSISDYISKGNYILVDFWASWCIPCMNEIPYIKAAYDHYGKKGFEIIGVSLDKNKEDWMNAVKKQNMNWIHLSDLNGCEAAVQPYLVTSIPHSVLIDPQGIILAKDLRGDELDKKLADIFRE